MVEDKLIKREQGLYDPVLDQVKAWQALMQKMKGLYYKKERKRRKEKTSDCVEEFNKNHRRQKMTNDEEESIKDTWHVRSKKDKDKSQRIMVAQKRREQTKRRRKFLLTSSYLLAGHSVSRFARSTPDRSAGSSQPVSRIRIFFGTAVWEKQIMQDFMRAGVSVFQARKRIVVVDYRHLQPNGLDTPPCPVLISVIFRPAEHVSLPHWRARSEFQQGTRLVFHFHQCLILPQQGSGCCGGALANAIPDHFCSVVAAAAPKLPQNFG